jgi:hypothetical protein
MSADLYLQQILQRETVNTGPYSPVLGVLTTLDPIIQRWADRFLVSVTPSGSFAKGTANRSGTDIDLFISLSSATPETLKEIHSTLHAALTSAGYKPRLQNVSLNVRVNGYDVDLVPGKRQDLYSEDHSLYRRRADTWTKTNVAKHIAHVRAGGRQSETRILKLWRNQKGLDFPSFYLELVTMRALALSIGGLADNVLRVFQFLSDQFASARIEDPANTNNIISDDLTAAERAKIKAAAERALAAKTWGEIIV